MKRKQITVDRSTFPSIFQPLLNNVVYDSSCSPEARVYYFPSHQVFLKRAPKGTLKKEALLTSYFYTLGLATEVLSYHSDENDWLLTAEVLGEDATHEDYLSDPLRLCDTMAEALRFLHTQPYHDCPIPDRLSDYFNTAREGYRIGRFDASFYPSDITPEKALAIVEEKGHLLKADTLIHGDYCLPNILLNDWRLSAFIDLGNGGVGDRHIDLYWGIWTLRFNLHTDRYCRRFMDAYGKDLIDKERLAVVAAAETLG